MRLLFIHNDYGEWSGEEAAAQGLAQVLADHGHEVSWFRRHSTEVMATPYGKVKAFFAGIHNPFAARALARRLDRDPVDLVQVQNLYPLLSPSILGPIKERGIPLVMRCPNYRLFCPSGLHLCGSRVCERCLSPGRELWCVLQNCAGDRCKSLGYAVRNAWARLSRSIVRQVDMFIVQTDFQKRKFTDQGIPAAHIGIVPGLAFEAGPIESNEMGDLVAFVGRVSPEKGIAEFLAAARRLPDVPFAVAGRDDGMPGLRVRAPENVTWLGFLSAGALRELYARSRVVVVPSRCYEGFPNVIVQAMAWGRPVVAAGLGAMTCIVDHGETGLLFTAGDPEDLVTQLRILYDDPDLCRRMGTAARERALTRYGPESVYGALRTVYQEAIEHNCRHGKRYSPKGRGDSVGRRPARSEAIASHNRF